MSQRPWYPFYPKDYQADTLALEADEHGIYRTLIDMAWQHGDGAVSGNMTELKITLQRLIVNLHGHTFNRIVPKLLKQYFVKREDGDFYHPRVESELAKARQISRKQSANVQQRWSRLSKNKDLTDTVVISTTLHTSYKNLPTGRIVRAEPPDPKQENKPLTISPELLAREQSSRPIPQEPKDRANGGSLATALSGERAREPPSEKPNGPASITRAEIEAMYARRRAATENG